MTTTPQDMLDRAAAAVHSDAERERVAVELAASATKLAGNLSAFLLVTGMPGAPVEFQKKLLCEMIDALTALATSLAVFREFRKAEP